jgi:hypothetical protein
VQEHLTHRVIVITVASGEVGGNKGEVNNAEEEEDEQVCQGVGHVEHDAENRQSGGGEWNRNKSFFLPTANVDNFTLILR